MASERPPSLGLEVNRRARFRLGQVGRSNGTPPPRARLLAVLRPPRPADITGLAPTGPVRVTGARVRRAAGVVRTFLRRRWLAFHVIVLALVTTMVLLGRWQLDVSNSKHFDWQNFGYSIQWWLFSAFGLFVWVRVMQHHLHPPQQSGAGSGLVLAGRGSAVARVGPVELAVPGDSPDDAPVVYRGYVMPQTSRRPVRSHGDGLHDAYNDYLWQLAEADGQTPSGEPPPAMPPAPSSARTSRPAIDAGEDR
jgi:hypothetical protein